MLRIITLALALAGCATSHDTGKARAEMERDRTEQAGQAMRDEFNRMTNDAN